MIGLRIKEERERLALTQQGLADAIEIAKRTLIDWEKGRTSPNAVQLSALSALGIDVLYIVTGMRNASLPTVMTESSLTKRQSALLDNYENTDEAGKKIIEATAAEVAQQIGLMKKSG
ncbi:helix-turn-helix domain-containing protein [Klebsiella michiganensis]|uniref:helix-turn-helix domain-containing protein n=1 Tax=Klebsiella michiganensis TaxID=1134687 RepID=UPI0015A74D4E|nr:helix-turn-helix transcriptional regulator [Klebsiella michiganensis]MEE1970229.1 helix-turn-helix transcriptional regulator [Klebsiella michiganensis]QLO25043.1 helix-turn-helix transcriptional regulator [Klebsiella michiganensis]